MDKNIISIHANYIADSIQSDLVKKTIWSSVSIVSHNIPLLSALNVAENILLPLLYFENISLTSGEKLVSNMLKQYDLDHILYQKTKSLSEYELLIVKYLRATVRKPKHIYFFLPHRMLTRGNYPLFVDFIKQIDEYEVTVVENYRYLDEYKELNFKEIQHN